jgi:hypothetical protein
MANFVIRLPPSFAMAPVVNLRTARKRAKRRKAEQEAAANRLAHGRTKAERNLERLRSDKALRSLDHHRIETGDE